MYEVENPVYQDFENIQEQYDENLIVMTNVNWGEHGHLLGGIVRYYGDDRKKLIKMWFNLKNYDEYGKCHFSTLMSDRGVHIHG